MVVSRLAGSLPLLFTCGMHDCMFEGPICLCDQHALAGCAVECTESEVRPAAGTPKQPEQWAQRSPQAWALTRLVTREEKRARPRPVLESR